MPERAPLSAAPLVLARGVSLPDLTAPVTLASFTDAEGAGAHCQAGAQRLLCARMLDWLDETLGTPAQLAEASVEKR